MVLKDISETELEKYIKDNLSEEDSEEYDSRLEIEKMIKQLDMYIDSIKRSTLSLKQMFREDVPNAYFINRELNNISLNLKRSVNKTNNISLYSGFLDKQERRNLIGEDVRFEMEGERLHIVFPSLLPRRINNNSVKTVYTSSDIRQLYEPSFRRFFENGKHVIYSKKAAIIYTHYFSSRKEFKDHDNFETKIITDLITGSLLLDDSPKNCAIVMDYKMGDKSHTEVDVIPFDDIKDFIG